MIMRVLAVGLVAGILAGLFVAALQHFATMPLIVAAEVFEGAHGAAGHAHGAADAVAGSGAAAGHTHATAAAGLPEASAIVAADNAISRTVATFTSSIGLCVGFALLLLGGMLLSDGQVTRNTALAWGVCGFLATGLAPALGVPPELPGMAADDPGGRQGWWFLAAACTAAGLFLLLRGFSATHGQPEAAALDGATVPLWQPLAGLALIALPHLLGAPQVPDAPSAVPAALAARFAAASLAMQAITWLSVAAGVGLFWPAISRALATAVSRPLETRHGG
jgi:cobalt transporter subunit CbtA